jgi:hypothetical protein
MKLKRFSIAMLAGAGLLPGAPASADEFVVHKHYYYDKKPKHDDRKGRGDHREDKKRKHTNEYGDYHYERPPVVIYRYRFYEPDSEAPAVPPSASKPRANAQPNFPRESAADRAAAKERQREILEKELATEQQLLTRARQRIAELEAVPPGAEGDDKRLRTYEDNLQNHEQNIQALRRELRNLDR